MRRKEMLQTIKDMLETDILKHTMINLDENTELGENGLGLDSLRFLKLLSLIEETMSVKIDDEYWNLNKLKTINDLLNCLLS